MTRYGTSNFGKYGWWAERSYPWYGTGLTKAEVQGAKSTGQMPKSYRDRVIATGHNDHGLPTVSCSDAADRGLDTVSGNDSADIKGPRSTSSEAYFNTISVDDEWAFYGHQNPGIKSTAGTGQHTYPVGWDSDIICKNG